MLAEMETTLRVYIEMWPYGRSVNLLPRFSHAIVFACRKCGKLAGLPDDVGAESESA
jgi:hypothetical protein